MYLVVVSRKSMHLQVEMARHYSQPKGFVGRTIAYAVFHDGILYGHIVGGSATLHLPNRDTFYGNEITGNLNGIVNNIFYHIEPVGGRYPLRNFTTAVVLAFEKQIAGDWKQKYGDDVVGFETLIEPPRTGELYLKAGWSLVGQTKGMTCKRIAGQETGSYTGQRVWDRKNLRPKLVFMKKA